MKTRTTPALALLFFVGVAYAHMDRILALLPDGTIPGLPARFGHVSLIISGLGGPTPTVVFNTNANHNHLPQCLTRLIRTRDRKDIFIAGSWDKNTSALPPYISARFFSPNYTPGHEYNSYIGIIFNLDNAHVIEVQRFVADPSGSGGKYYAVDLPKGCTPSRHVD